MFLPVKVSRSYQSIVEQIEGLISTGQLQVGDKLPGERELSEQFQVSRVVLREAIRDLETRGIVRTQRGSGTFVEMMPSAAITRSLTLLLELDKASLLELMLARQALEGVTASLAAQNASPTQLKRLNQCLAEMTRVAEAGLHVESNFQAYGQGDIDLHLLIAHAAGNKPIETLLATILPLVKAGRLEIIRRFGSLDAFRAQTDVQLVQHQAHVDLVHAINEQNAELAKQLMHAHLEHIAKVYGNIGVP